MQNQNEKKTAESAVEIATARRAAAQDLILLFGGTTVKGEILPGSLSRCPIATLETDQRWKELLDRVRKNPHAKTLAIVTSARGNSNFSPALVAELFSDENRTEDSRNWFAEVFLGGLAEIFRTTGVGIMVPPNQAGLDLVRSAYNVVSHLSDEERRRLNCFMPDESPRRQLSSDLTAILGETMAESSSLSSVQRLYRWAMNSWADRQERLDERRNFKQNQSSNYKPAPAEDPASALPAPSANASATTGIPAVPGTAASTTEITPAPIPVPIPVETSAPKAEVPAAPIPSLPPMAPTQVQARAAVPATTEDQDRELVYKALSASGTPGKAMVALVRRGEKTYAEAEAFAKAKGLLD